MPWQFCRSKIYKARKLNTIAQVRGENLGFLLKSEVRNPKFETISNVKNTNFQNKLAHTRNALFDILVICILNLFRVSIFGFRI